MAKYIRMGYRYWDHNQNRWVVATWDMHNNDMIFFNALNIEAATNTSQSTYWFGCFRGVIDTVKRCVDPINKMCITCHLDGAGYPYLVFSQHEDFYAIQSVILNTAGNRLNYFDELERTSTGPGGAPHPRDPLRYQWMNDVGCLKRPGELKVGSTAGDGTFNSMPAVLGIVPSYEATMLSPDWVKTLCNYIGTTVKTVDSGTRNIIYNSANSLKQQVNLVSAGVGDLWAGDLQSHATLSSNDSYTWQPLLSIRLSHHRNFYHSVYDPYQSRHPNVSGWWRPVNFNGSSVSVIPDNVTFNDYEFSNHMAPWRGIRTSMFYICGGYVHLPGRDEQVIMNPINDCAFPWIGAIHPLACAELKGIMSSQNIRPANMAYLCSDGVFSTYQYNGGEVSANGQAGSFGIHAVTYENGSPLLDTSGKIIDCIIAPSLFSDWPAIDFYGVQPANMNNVEPGTFVWDTNYDSNWETINEVRIHRTVNYESEPVPWDSDYEWPWPSQLNRGRLDTDFLDLCDYVSNMDFPGIQSDLDPLYDPDWAQWSYEQWTLGVPGYEWSGYEDTWHGLKHVIEDQAYTCNRLVLNDLIAHGLWTQNCTTLLLNTDPIIKWHDYDHICTSLKTALYQAPQHPSLETLFGVNPANKDMVIFVYDQPNNTIHYFSIRSDYVPPECKWMDNLWRTNAISNRLYWYAFCSAFWAD